MVYIAQADVENALGKNVVKAIFDDDQDGVVDGAPMTACVNYASAQVDAFLAGTYDITLPIAAPDDIVKFAAVDFACAYATRRRPDLVRAMNEKSWTDFRDAAIANMKLFASGLKRISTGTAATATSPANAGGFITEDGARISTTSSDGTDNQGDF